MNELIFLSSIQNCPCLRWTVGEAVDVEWVRSSEWKMLHAAPQVTRPAPRVHLLIPDAHKLGKFEYWKSKLFCVLKKFTFFVSKFGMAATLGQLPGRRTCPLAHKTHSAATATKYQNLSMSSRKCSLGNGFLSLNVEMPENTHQSLFCIITNCKNVA